MGDELIRQPSFGVNQSGVRVYNERLLLTMLQRRGAMPGSDLARVAGLSPQTVSVILRKLEKDGILERGAPTKGKVGKPSVPMRLAANGVLAYGLKLGRRAADLVVMNFHGQVHRQLTTRYQYPMPEQIHDFLADGLDRLANDLSARDRSRLCGLGIAAPFELWNWTEKMDVPDAYYGAWRDTDIRALVGSVTDLPVSLINDATAACQAEHVFGNGKNFRDYAYFYVGAIIGGGIVLNDSVFEGNQNNAGAFGPMRMGTYDGQEKQLIDTASLYLLENELEAAGHDKQMIWDFPQDWSGIADVADKWIARTAEELARASLTTCSVIDMEAIVIDGTFPDNVRQTLVVATRAAMMRLDRRGLVTPRIEAGNVGVNARAIGAAYHPISTRFLLNTNAGFVN